MAGEIGSDNRGTAIRNNIGGFAVLIVLIVGVVILLQFREDLFGFLSARDVSSSQRALLQRVLITCVAISAASIGTIAGKFVFGVLNSNVNSEDIAFITRRALGFIILTGLLVAFTLSGLSSPNLESEFRWVTALAIVLGMLYAKAEVSGAVRTEDELRTTRAGLEETSTQLGNTETELDEARRTLGDTEADLEETTAELEGTRFLLKELEADLEETNTELEETRTELENTRIEAEGRGADLEEANASLEETSDRLEHTETELETTSTELSETRSEADEAKSELERAGAELERTRAKLGEMSTESEDVEAELEETRTELQSTSTQLAEMRDELGRASTVSEETETELADTRAELEARRKELAETETELKEARTESERASAEIEETLLALEDTNDELNETRATLATTEEELRKCIAAEQELSPSGLVIEIVGDADDEDAVFVRLTNEGEETFNLGGCAMVDSNDKRFRGFPDGFELDAGDSETFEIEDGADIERSEPVGLYRNDEPIGRIRWRN